MKGLSLAFVTISVFAIAVPAMAEDSTSKRKTYEITQGTDDAEENLSGGTMYLDGHLELCYHDWGTGGRNQIIGLRFPKFELPEGVVVDSAYLQFFSIDTETGTANFTINGEASVNSSTFAITAYNLSSRPKTSASVTWSVPGWNGWGYEGSAQRSPDISPIIREIAGQSGFTSDSPITLFLQGSGTRIAASFDERPTDAPLLIINYHYPDVAANTAPYAERYLGLFPMGTAMSSSDLNEYFNNFSHKDIFNHFTAEYEMKWDQTQPAYNVFDFDGWDGGPGGADAIANYARQHNMKITGHTLLWHSSNPAWLFQNGPDGAVSQSVLSSRLKNHINKMVERYGDVVDNWDVVNEAISTKSDDLNKIYRDASEGSQWWGVFGSPEFIKLAFQYAAEANLTYGHDSKLFYNDYDVPDPVKLEKILKMVDYLQANGVKIDGVGFQGHWCLANYRISQIKSAFDKIIAKGLKIKISEMDISIYDKKYYLHNNYTAPLSSEAEQEQAYRYQELFDLFREYKEHIHSVTFWGVYDGPGSWLNYDDSTWELLPESEWDFPLLFDVNLNPKKAFYSIMDFNAEGAATGPKVSFTSSSQSVVEGAGSVTVTVQLSAVNSDDVTVPFTVGGTATKGGVDHNLSDSSISIPAGQTSGATTFSVINDTQDEPNESVVVTMGTPVNASKGSTNVHTVTIVDDDEPTVSFSAASQSVAESIGAVTVTAQLSAASGSAVTVPFTVSGSATGGGTDYNLASSSINIPAGQSSGSISFTVNNDTQDEDDESVVFTMDTPTNATKGGMTVHSVTITDNDATPTVKFTSSSQSVAENVVTQKTITAQLSAVSGRNVTVPYMVTGTATGGGVDYTISASPIVIPAGKTTAIATFAVNNDALDESSETIVVTMGTPVNASKGTRTVHTATITDDDATPSVKFTSSGQTVAESDGAVSVVVGLSAISGRNVTVPFSTSGTATKGTDYTITASPITIPAGQQTASATFTPVKDSVTESNETAKLTMGTPTNASKGSPYIHTVTITNN